jgi:cytochrome c5
MAGYSWRVGFLGLSVVVALAACREAPPAEQPDEPSSTVPERRQELLLAAASIALPPAGVQPGDLPEPQSQGAQLVGKYCTQCHDLPAPAAHSATDWPSVVRRMWLRMEWLPATYGVKVPTVGERSTMLEYLTRNGLQVSGSTLPAGHGREVFAEVCSRCHALPDPRVHSAQDWAVVFQRMERNMLRMKLAPLTREQTADVLGYLQDVASRRGAGG